MARRKEGRIVGVDELEFEPDAVSWISPLGKALLNADIGDWIKLHDGRSAKIVKIEFKTGSDQNSGPSLLLKKSRSIVLRLQ